MWWWPLRDRSGDLRGYGAGSWHGIRSEGTLKFKLGKNLINAVNDEANKMSTGFRSQMHSVTAEERWRGNEGRKISYLTVSKLGNHIKEKRSEAW